MKKTKIILWTIILAIIASTLYINYIGKVFNPVLYKYVNKEVKRFITNVVNTSVNDIISNYSTDEMFIIRKNDKQEIETIDLNTKKINIILKEINHEILTKIQKLEMGDIEDLQVSNIFKEGKYKKIKRGVLCELPLNILRKNITLSNIGPTVPIKLSFSGNVKTKTKTTTKNYGINNIVVEVIVEVEINEQVTMPTSSKETTLLIEAPLVLKIVQGKVPEYYETDINGNSITSTIFSN